MGGCFSDCTHIGVAGGGGERGPAKPKAQQFLGTPAGLWREFWSSVFRLPNQSPSIARSARTKFPHLGLLLRKKNIKNPPSQKDLPPNCCCVRDAFGCGGGGLTAARSCCWPLDDVSHPFLQQQQQLQQQLQQQQFAPKWLRRQKCSTCKSAVVGPPCCTLLHHIGC